MVVLWAAGLVARMAALLVLVKDISSSLLIALLELAVLGAVDLLRNESEVTGDGLCVDQLCWN